MSLRLEAARRLFTKARDDRYIVARLADDPMAPAWAVGFHAQQAVEKALKAVLAGHEFTARTMAVLVPQITPNPLSRPGVSNGVGLPSRAQGRPIFGAVVPVKGGV